MGRTTWRACLLFGSVLCFAILANVPCSIAVGASRKILQDGPGAAADASLPFPTVGSQDSSLGPTGAPSRQGDFSVQSGQAPANEPALLVKLGADDVVPALGVQAAVAVASTEVVSIQGVNAAKYVEAAATQEVMTSEFYVELKPWANISAVVDEQVLPNGAVDLTSFRFPSGYQGFALRAPVDSTSAVLQSLVDDVRVARIEPNAVISIASTTQAEPDWGLDRIDQIARNPPSGTYTHASNGSGIYAYIVDTGILPTHVQFQGRMASGTQCDGTNPCTPTRVLAGATAFPAQGTSDDNGHGTHVAGTVGGVTVGVAPGCTLVPVKACGPDGKCTISGIAAGVAWAVNHLIDTDLAKSNKKKVINMSLAAAGINTALENAVEAAFKAGIAVMTAAGNAQQNKPPVDGCGISPGRTPRAMNVGSIDDQDLRSSFSNFGRCVDIFAPGSDIKSASNAGPTQYRLLSGTSMACPMVTGAAARMLSAGLCGRDNKHTALCLYRRLLSTSNRNKVRKLGVGSPNRLLYVDPSL